MGKEDLFSVRGLVVLVTGAAHGLGAVYADALAARGARLVLADIDAEALTERAARLDSAEVLTISADVSNVEDAGRLIKAAVERFGRLDVLVNNAGIALPKRSVEDIPPDEWERILGVNLSGAFFCLQAAARAMVATGGGSIVNVASTVAVIGIPRIAAYTATKGGIAALTRAAAVDLAGSGIRVNALAPGFIETEMTLANLRSPDTAEQWRTMISRIPMERAGRPDELVGALVFLCSPASSYVTGTTLFVDGGYVVQ